MSTIECTVGLLRKEELLIKTANIRTHITPRSRRGYHIYGSAQARSVLERRVCAVVQADIKLLLTTLCLAKFL